MGRDPGEPGGARRVLPGRGPLTRANRASLADPARTPGGRRRLQPLPAEVGGPRGEGGVRRVLGPAVLLSGEGSARLLRSPARSRARRRGLERGGARLDRRLQPAVPVVLRPDRLEPRLGAPPLGEVLASRAARRRALRLLPFSLGPGAPSPGAVDGGDPAGPLDVRPAPGPPVVGPGGGLPGLLCAAPFGGLLSRGHDPCAAAGPRRQSHARTLARPAPARRERPGDPDRRGRRRDRAPGGHLPRVRTRRGPRPSRLERPDGAAMGREPAELAAARGLESLRRLVAGRSRPLRERPLPGFPGDRALRRRRRPGRPRSARRGQGVALFSVPAAAAGSRRRVRHWRCPAMAMAMGMAAGLARSRHPRMARRGAPHLERHTALRGARRPVAAAAQLRPALRAGPRRRGALGSPPSAGDRPLARAVERSARAVAARRAPSGRHHGAAARP